VLSNGLNWVGRLSFFLGCALALTTLAAQSFYWLKTAEWMPFSFERGLTSVHLGPLRCTWRGVQLMFDYVNATPFSVTIFLLGGFIFFVARWLADKIPAKWEADPASQVPPVDPKPPAPRAVSPSV
jgi:hypothetical protein